MFNDHYHLIIKFTTVLYTYIRSIKGLFIGEYYSCFFIVDLYNSSNF